MDTDQQPKCPRCGNASPTLISIHPRHASNDAGRTRPPVGTSYVYSCPACDLSFTHEDDKPPKTK